MQTHLVFFGAIAAAEIVPGAGLVDVPADAIAKIVKVVASGGTASDLPVGAFVWARPFAPRDNAPYAFSWAGLLDEGETIASIEGITMSALGASLGVKVDTDPARLPTIDAEYKLVSLWFLVADAFQANAAFAGNGTQVGTAMRIRTTDNPSRVYERTAVLTVRRQ